MVDTVTYIICAALGFAIDGERVPYVAAWGRTRRARRRSTTSRPPIDDLARRIETAIRPPAVTE
jgi:hypothetical protein